MTVVNGKKDKTTNEVLTRKKIADKVNDTLRKTVSMRLF